MAEEACEVAEHAVIPVRVRPDAIDEVRTGQMELVAGHSLALVLEERIGLVAKELEDFGIHGFGFRFMFNGRRAGRGTSFFGRVVTGAGEGNVRLETRATKTVPESKGASGHTIYPGSRLGGVACVADLFNR